MVVIGTRLQSPTAKLYVPTYILYAYIRTHIFAELYNEIFFCVDLLLFFFPHFSFFVNDDT